MLFQIAKWNGVKHLYLEDEPKEDTGIVRENAVEREKRMVKSMYPPVMYSDSGEPKTELGVEDAKESEDEQHALLGSDDLYPIPEIIDMPAYLLEVQGYHKSHMGHGESKEESLDDLFDSNPSSSTYKLLFHSMYLRRTIFMTVVAFCSGFMGTGIDYFTTNLEETDDTSDTTCSFEYTYLILSVSGYFYVFDVMNFMYLCMYLCMYAFMYAFMNVYHLSRRSWSL